MFELLKRYSARYRRELVAGPAFKLVEVVFDLLVPLVVAHLIDQGVACADVAVVWHDGLVLLAMALTGFLFSLICQKMAARASQGIGTTLRSKLYEHINLLSAAEIDRFGTASLVTRLTGDVNQVQLAVALGIRQLVRWPPLALGSLIAALTIDAALGGVFIVALAVVILLFWLIMKACIPLFFRMQALLDRLGATVRENLAGARVVRAFVREQHERTRFADEAQRQAATSLAAAKLSALLNPCTLVVMNLAVCVVLWRGGVRVQMGELTQGAVVALVNYLTQIMLSVIYVANLIVVFTKASACAGRVMEVLCCKPGVVEASPAAFLSAVPPAGQVALRLHRVSYVYPGSGVPAVREVSLSVPMRATVGIIGGTGSGKSTVLALMARLMDPAQGKVELFGGDIRSYRLSEVRRAIGFVPQRVTLLSGTIRTNLLWRDARASDAELRRSLTCAQAWPFVKGLPLGLDAPVEAGGRNFSGGQRQRLTIARALVGSPHLLLLDDAASALDAKTDAALRASLASLGTTAVIVSQRVSAVRGADIIYVMEHGRVVGAGTHDELLITCDAYREICRSQDVIGEACS